MSRQPVYPGSFNDALQKDIKRVGFEALTLGFPDYATGRSMAESTKYNTIKQGPSYCNTQKGVKPVKNKNKKELFDFPDVLSINN